MSSIQALAVILLNVPAFLAGAELPLRWKANPREINRDSGETGKGLRPDRLHLLLEFRQAQGEADREGLRLQGVRIVGHGPGNSLLVTAPAGWDQGAVAGLERAVKLDRSAKISPMLGGVEREGIRSATPEDRAGVFLVEFHPDVAWDEARQVIHSSGLEVRDHPDLLSGHHLVAGTRQRALALADWDEVAYVFPASPELRDGAPVRACPGALTEFGRLGQAVASSERMAWGSGKEPVSLGFVLSQPYGGLPADSVRAEILRAMAEWSGHVQVRFIPSDSGTAAQTVNILFASGSHGDPFPFDGAGGTLAHTFFPPPLAPEPLAGDMHFDAAEGWRLGADIDVYSVSLHELGHALGLAHSDDPSAVMYPYYRQLSTLRPSDIQAIQGLYLAPGANGRLNLQITAPSGTAVETAAASFALSGTVTGATGKASVQWTTNRGYAGTAEGAAEWRIPAVPLEAGRNLITVSVVDDTGVPVTQAVAVERNTGQAVTPIEVTAGSVVTTFQGTVVLKGKASLAGGVKQVAWSTSRLATGKAAGTEEWTTSPVAVPLGITTVYIYAQGFSGVVKTISVSVTRR
jgi:hypothetical protein